MGLGALVYKTRKLFRGGLRASYFREMVRPRILRTPPVHGTDDGRCEIHVLTSAADWLDLLWALKSFYRHSGRRYRLCIHDDGTLGPERIATLTAHFPNGRVIPRADADAAVPPGLTAFPRCREFRRTNHLAPKVFDFAHYLTADRLMLLDSDVLFFAVPTSLVSRIEDAGYRKNSVNADVASAYTVDAGVVQQQTGVRLVERFNSGLGLIHRESLRLDWIEEFLGLPGVLGHFWRIEQTLIALCSSRFGVELLPAEYDVRLIGGVEYRPCRHYVGGIRQKLYAEGIASLMRGGFLRPEGG